MKTHYLPIPSAKAALKTWIFFSEVSLSIRDNFAGQLHKVSYAIRHADGEHDKSYVAALSYYVFNILKQGLRENFLGSETEMEFVMIVLRSYLQSLSNAARYYSAKVQEISAKNVFRLNMLNKNQKQAA